MSQFRWSALKRGTDFGDLSDFGDDLGVYKGEIEGTWGVTTWKLNPVTSSYYVTMFAREGDAINYARKRARAGPPLNLPKEPGEKRPKRNPKANAYFVMHMPTHQYAEDEQRKMIPIYRVVRGMLPGSQYGPKRHEGAPSGRLMGVPAILVLKASGSLPGVDIHGHPNIRWKPDRKYTTSIINLDEERERRQRGQYRK